MKLYYIANAKIPSEKAHTLQIMKMCEAFAELGLDVELVVPFRIQLNEKLKKHDPFEYYHVKKIFKIRKIPSPDLIRVGDFFPKFSMLLYNIQALLFALLATFYISLKRADIIYTRSIHTALFLVLTGKGNKLIYEAHAFPKEGITRRIELWISKKIRAFVVITKALKSHYVRYGAPEDRIIVAPDAVDLRMFDCKIPKKEARKLLGIPLDRKVVCYTGHLYKWKGVYVLALAARELDALVYFIGGTSEDIEKLGEFVKENKISNAIVVGHVPPSYVPIYLKASDVVVLPNIKEGLSEFTSPLKLFEYMASRRPIVASDLPVIREILNEENAILVEPENPKALAEGIKKALEDYNLATKVAKKAYKDVWEYIWEERARKILKSAGGHL